MHRTYQYFINFVLMIVKTRAIVLRSLKYGDQNLIVDLYTETYGRITSMVKVSTTAKGKMKKQLFQPLTALQVEMEYRQNQQMQKLRDVQIDIPWTQLSLEPVKMTIGMFLAEVLYYVTRQEQQDTPLYQFLINSLQWLDLTAGSVANFHIAFLIRLTRFLGFMPVADDYMSGSLFDLRTGEFIMLTPVHTDFLTKSDADRMYNLLRISYPTMHLFRMTRQDRQRCLDIILRYYRLHTTNFPELKSLAIMKEIFDL